MQNLDNQTQFSAEEPVFETPDRVQEPVSQQPLVPWYKTKKIILLALPALVFMLILVLALSRRMPTEQIVEVTPSPAPIQLPDTPMAARIKNLRRALTAADPSKQTLVYPPVDMEISLEQ